MTVVVGGAAAGARCVHATAAAACRGAVRSPAFTAQPTHLGQRFQNQFSSPWVRPCVSLGPHRRTTMSMSAAPQAAASSEAGGAGSSPSVAAVQQQQQQDFLVQYVVVRKDLWGSMGWPLGSVVAQACHASSAAMWMFRDEEDTQKYLAPENIDHMRKVVLEVKDEAALRKLAEALAGGGIGHKLWVEQPEDYPTCLATRPYPKSRVAQYFKKFQLSKAPIG
ncbi:hypothetical protein PLESTB_001658600 [Pleodorina starrii]|uniref:peptidyl-tRNA hydrolase n=1 Tax=Pleodorina starrii TaxID=330485 RepID=A0A9W6F9G1_9CHLO|nr:hypothetical protein PLESTB_001658600 [Pleodorina starrii]GLC69688.1 hypothetical protein PLESTF_000864900 [Pleodorina starrii]